MLRYYSLLSEFKPFVSILFLFIYFFQFAAVYLVRKERKKTSFVSTTTDIDILIHFFGFHLSSAAQQIYFNFSSIMWVCCMCECELEMNEVSHGETIYNQVKWEMNYAKLHVWVCLSSTLYVSIYIAFISINLFWIFFFFAFLFIVKRMQTHCVFVYGCVPYACACVSS